MFRTRWQLFRLAGIPINLDISWLIILALLTATLASFFHGEIRTLSEGAVWGLGLATALAFFVCIILHELGHALVAQRLGIPLRGITLFVFGGVAELEGEPQSAGNEFLMAIAGPIVSAVLAAVFWLLASGGAQAGWSPAALLFCYELFWINTVVLLFNLVPAFPLDGGRVLRSFLWAVSGNLRRATYWASLLGRTFAWVLIFWGIYLFFFVPMPGHIINGLWLGLIGWFLYEAAQGSYQQVLIRQALQGEPIRHFMNPTPVIVPPELDLEHWVDDYIFRYHHKMYPVAANGHLEGIVVTSVLSRVPREEWGLHSISEVMRSDLRDLCLPPHTDALHALEQMQRIGASRLLVTEGDHLVGLISLKDLMRFLQMKLDLESSGGDDTGSSWTPYLRQTDERTKTRP